MTAQIKSAQEAYVLIDQLIIFAQLFLSFFKGKLLTMALVNVVIILLSSVIGIAGTLLSVTLKKQGILSTYFERAITPKRF